MLNEQLKTQLRIHLEKITQPIELVAALDDGPKSRELDALLQEVAALSPLVSVREQAFDDGRTPSFAINRVGSVSGIRFAGIPLGHEFTSFVLALLQAGGYPPRAAAATLQQAANLTGSYHFETYFSLSCQNCPDVVQALNLLCVLNPRVSHTAIDGALYADEVAARDVMSVPSVFLNGQPFASGRMGLDEILAKLDTGAAERVAQELSTRDPYDVLVVGGGPAGVAAAIYAARKGIRTGLVAGRLGGQVLDTMAIENFISVPATDGPRLGSALGAHVAGHDVDVMPLQQARRLVPADAATGGFLGVELESGASLRARSIVLATGARWRHMDVPGEADYRNRGVAYCPHCDGPLYKGKRVAVIGGGNSGVEAAIDLAGITAHVTLLEFDGRLRADEVLQRKLRSLPNVDVITSAQTTAVLGDGRRVTGLAWHDRATGGDRQLTLDGIFVQIGLLPNTEWLRGGLALSPRGEIVIDARGATSQPGVFAAGDATTVPYKQIVIAMGTGSTAALSAFDHLIRSPAPAATAAAPTAAALEAPEPA